jgi:nitroreductase
MDTLKALKQRKSVRAYSAKDVPDELVKEILQASKHSPSGVNTQPWEVYVVKGEKKKQIEQKVQNAFESGKKETMDYNYYPLVWEEPFKSRRKHTGLLMYETLGITREDKQRQKEQWKANYRAFDAPVVLYFFIDKTLQKGSYLDYGMFIQSIMLAAVSLGLGTCTQAALAEYPGIVKECLNVDDSKALICGMALGYEDKDAPINSYRTPRVDIEEFTRFVQ